MEIDSLRNKIINCFFGKAAGGRLGAIMGILGIDDVKNKLYLTKKECKFF